MVSNNLPKIISMHHTNMNLTKKQLTKNSTHSTIFQYINPNINEKEDTNNPENHLASKLVNRQLSIRFLTDSVTETV